MLRPIRATLRRAPWLVLGPAALLAVGAVLMAIERQADRHLAADAERTAMAWARHIAAGVPDIRLVFAGEPPTPQARERLESLRGIDGLFRFKLYAPDGRLRLISDSVATGPRPEDHSRKETESAARAVRERRSVVYLQRGDGARRPAVYSEAYVPVRQGDDVVGVVEVYLDQTALARSTAESFRAVAVSAGSVLGLVFLAAGLLWRWRARLDREAEQRLQYLSCHDMLTGALNATHFRDALACACRQQAPVAVLCIDIDRFSDVNDSHGRAAGDRLLREVVERLRGVLRGADVLARLAGDRYAVLQRDVGDSSAVEGLAQRIVDSLARPYALDGGAAPIVATASVGAAIRGIDGGDPDSLLNNAELALQRAKTGGCGAWSFYDARLDRVLQERRVLARELHDAIAGDGLKLHFQPVFAAHGTQPIGYEALVRWQHPARGAVSPGDFIPVAEESGQIEALGRWVLYGACREAARWPQPLSVAVNLSPAQFRRDGAIVDEVRAVLAATGLPPDRLELEITESLLMNHTEPVLHALRRLQALGVRIAMDDFGTGYSSLATLWRFPFDRLKIDRAFTLGLGGDGKAEAIVRSIVTLAHALAIRVTAEGVETDDQRRALERHGCDELQGFLLGRPLPPERLRHRMDGAVEEAMPA